MICVSRDGPRRAGQHLLRVSFVPAVVTWTVSEVVIQNLVLVLALCALACYLVAAAIVPIFPLPPQQLRMFQTAHLD